MRRLRIRVLQVAPNNRRNKIPFVKGYDPNRNNAGRVPKKTRENIGKDELELMLRRLKPLSRIALTKLGVILEDEETGHATRLKAVMLVLDKYKELVQQLYIEDESEDEAEDLKAAEVRPLFSLHVIPKEGEESQ